MTLHKYTCDTIGMVALVIAVLTIIASLDKMAAGLGL
jgi:hypothetical protein